MSCTSGQRMFHNNEAFTILHTVYLDLKEDISKDEMDSFMEAVEELHRITIVRDFKHGAFEDLGDARAMQEFEYALVMGFQNKEDYIIYQKHPIHSQVKNKLKPYLAGPPVTYDLKLFVKTK